MQAGDGAQAKQACLLLPTEQGLELRSGEGLEWSFQWSEVSRIRTYKVDLFSVDMVCLEFDLGPAKATCTAHDDMNGFARLCDVIRRAFPSIREDWWSRVAFPAFATNSEVLYDRESG